MIYLVKRAIFLGLNVGIVLSACSDGCKKCLYSTKCFECESSYFLSHDYCSQCPPDCASCNNWDDCISCKPKRFGLNKRCSFDCSDLCVDSACEDDTGYCFQCKHGLYGPKCQYNCSSCFEDKCESRECSSRCKDGYYVIELEEARSCGHCPLDCKHCKNSTVCNVCNDGFYLYRNGDNVYCAPCTYESQCSDSCHIPGCSQCQIQNKSLVCTACEEGLIFNGKTCDSHTPTCYEECSTYCDRSELCQGICKIDWTGKGCPAKCLDECLKCSNKNGGLCQQCKGLFYAANCSLECNLSCEEVNGKNTCRNSDGYCLNGCKQAFWGDTCIKSCSNGCQSSNCARNNGTCTTGCREGYSGDTCTQTTMSKQDTTANPAETSSSETVTKGTQEKQQKKGEVNDIIIKGAAFGGGFVVLILISVAGFCFFKRRRNSHSDVSAQIEVIVAEDQTLYAKPMMKTAVVHETQDYTYAKPNKSHKIKTPSTREISNQRTVYDNIAIDLDDDTNVTVGAYATISVDKDVESQTEEEIDIDKIELEEFEEEDFKLIETEVNPPSADIYYNTESLTRSRIQISDILEYIMKKTDYEDEFEKLPKGLIRTCDEALTRINRMKNRYNGVFAYDATRVILNSKTYINANYIDGHKESPEYIASLGPTKTAMNGFKDFWEMIWQEETKTIIMLTNLDESGKMKCEQYWPNQGKTKNYHGYKVTCTSEQTFSEFTIRELSLTMHGHESRKVTQYHYTAWPDRSVPDNFASLIEFRNKVEQTKSQDSGPMVVHCSAGIGRTGTYIALDILMQEGMDENYVDIFGRVIALRGQRGHMVQNLEQYIFLHRCLLYALTCDADPLPVKDIPLIMTQDKVSNQYKIFMKIDKPNISKRKSSANKKIMKENRNGADIPNEEYRVRLTHSKHDYINAVYVNGYKTQYKFIVAQTPLQNTVEDFISMVYQEKCACILDLDDENLNDTSVGQYLPQDRKATKVGHFQVACKNVETMGHVVIRDLTISRTGLHLSGVLHLKHYQFKGWNKSDKVPNSVKPLFELVNDVENEIKDQREIRPITIHCLNGVDRSCLFCAVSIILEKCNIEAKISILNIICQLRSRRKSAFTDIAHYRFCYKCVNNLSKNSDKRRYNNMAQLL